MANFPYRRAVASRLAVRIFVENIKRHADIRTGKVDVIVVYKVDRLTCRNSKIAPRISSV